MSMGAGGEVRLVVAAVARQAVGREVQGLVARGIRAAGLDEGLVAVMPAPTASRGGMAVVGQARVAVLNVRRREGHRRSLSHRRRISSRLGRARRACITPRVRCLGHTTPCLL